MNAGSLSVIFFACIVAGTVLAQVVPEDLTETQVRRLDRYVLEFIGANRMPDAQPQPPMAREFNERYTAFCLERVEREYADHGRWFYCEDRKDLSPSMRWDEVITFRAYWQLVTQRGGLEKVPHYSEENRQQAVAFWRQWQKEDGSFFNLFTNRGDRDHSNGKYIPELLKLLGASPKYPTSGYGAAEIDTLAFLRGCAANQGNEQGATAAVILTRIHEGRTDMIPVLERGLELFLGHLNPETGMFHGMNTLSENELRGYWGTAETMKLLARIVGYMGIENLPARRQRADTYLASQTNFREGNVAVKRNTAEMLIQCLMESTYRRDDLLEALQKHSEVIMTGQPWNSMDQADYVVYTLLLFGPYLHWEGYEDLAPRTPFYNGMGHDWRVVVGPFGRSVNVIRKTEEERIWHADWTAERYGLQARNAAHERKQVVDVVPVSEAWETSRDAEGRFVLTRDFQLPATDLSDPHVKILWQGGDIDILVNDCLVTRKLGGLADYGAVALRPEARASLKTGANTLTIRSAAGVEHPPQVSAGIIDWVAR